MTWAYSLRHLPIYKREYLNYYRINIIIKDYKDKELTLSVEFRIDTFTSQELDRKINDELGNFDSLIMILLISNTFQVQGLGY